MAFDRTWRALLTLFALAIAGPTVAAEFDVDSTLDAVDANPGDGACASATLPTVCTLRAAIQEANALEGADRIVLPPGTYLLSLSGAGEDASASGDLDIGSEIVLSGSEPATTIIESTGGDRVLHVLNGGIATVTGVTLRGGGSVSAGGGVLNNGVLAMQLCVIENNGGDDRVVTFGAGIANTSGAVALTGCEVRSNSAGSIGSLGSGGGGVYNALTMAINGSRIVDNQSLGSGNSGGGVYSTTPAFTLIATTTIRSNSAASGGGLAMAGGSLYLNASAVQANLANGSTVQAGRGGGLRVNGGSAYLVNVSLSQNAANQDGGGLQLAAGSADLRNVTISGNIADQDLNTSGNGGGLFAAEGTALSARNSIIADNLDGGGASHPDCSGPLTSAGYLWLLEDAGCALTAAIGDAVGIDPQLLKLADNGGLTLTHALAESSPAIDTGNPDGCIGNTFPNGKSEPVDAPLLLDQRQRLRPVDGDLDEIRVCDPGAFEFVPAGVDPELIFYGGFEPLPGSG